MSARRYTGSGARRLPDKRILIIMGPVEVMEAITPRSSPYSIDHTQARPRTRRRMCDGCEALGAYPLSALELVAIFEEGELPGGVFSVVCYESMLVAQEESDLQGGGAHLAVRRR